MQVVEIENTRDEKAKLMGQLANVVIVISHCNRTRESFGIRFEEKVEGEWAADWAFPVREALAKKEGYDQATIGGIITRDYEYPGCPYCKNDSFFQCGGCDKVSCYNSSFSVSTCGWCGNRGPVEGSIKKLKAGGDLL
jgi:hypothetical protein